MNEQTTHTTNDTVDPQFLGPGAGQQAGVKTSGVSELDVNGLELHRGLSVARGAELPYSAKGAPIFVKVLTQTDEA